MHIKFNIYMKMKFQIIILIVTVGNIYCTVNEEWENFQINYGKAYNTLEEREHRFTIFKNNLKTIDDHNRNFEKGLVTYKLGVNKFADITPEEFVAKFKLRKQNTFIYNDTVRNVSTTGYPENFDWREKGAVTHVKDQGDCGACYIFSTVGVLEGYYFRKNKKLVSLSEQNVVDCMHNATCFGGSSVLVFLHVAERQGINTEYDYPYEGSHVKCRYDISKSVKLNFTKILRANTSEEGVKRALVEHGPLSVGLYVDSKWMLYKSGVWYHRECSDIPNHAMLLVGYGTENGQDYWLLKNSMGKGWGDAGYLKLARNKHENYCGLTKYALFVI